jgi:hypothetical protein
MSYTIHLHGKPCDKCGLLPNEPDDLPDPIYNLTPIFDLALTGEPYPNGNVSEVEVALFRKETDRPRGLRLLHGKLASETSDMIARALDRMADPAMAPAFAGKELDNRWGGLTGAIKIMRRLLEAARDCPGLTWDIR